MLSARQAVLVPWQRRHSGPEASTVVHKWISTCSVTEELKAGGTDDVCEWWLVSTSADLFIRNASPQTPLVKQVLITHELSGTGPCFRSIQNDRKDEDSIRVITWWGERWNSAIYYDLGKPYCCVLLQYIS